MSVCVVYMCVLCLGVVCVSVSLCMSVYGVYVCVVSVCGVCVVYMCASSCSYECVRSKVSTGCFFYCSLFFTTRSLSEPRAQQSS